jgi:serpin B
MMTQEGIFWLARQDGFEALELPYAGETLAMTLIVPRETSITEFESKFTAAALRDLYSALSPQEVTVTLPRFSVRSSVEAVPIFKSLGITRAFQGADFSGISPRIASISGVFHKVAVDVAEEGTEAAAATAVAFTRSAALPKPKFVVDRPFIFIIRDKHTSLPLFIGRILDPVKGTRE